jgi:hypothetical protein
MSETLKTDIESPKSTNMFAISSPMYFGLVLNQEESLKEFQAPLFGGDSFEPFIEKHLKVHFYDLEQYFETSSAREAWAKALEHHKAAIERDLKAYETFIIMIKDFLEMVKSDMKHNPELMSGGYDAAPVYQTRWEQISKNLDLPFRKIHRSLIDYQKLVIDLEEN